MLYELAKMLSHHFHLAVIQYITLRAVFSTLTAFIIVLCFAPFTIKQLINHQLQQIIRDNGPKSHANKANTPTMGGILIIAAIVASTLLWANLANRAVWIVILTMVAFAIIGWLDDYLKISRNSSCGLSAKKKYSYQSIIALLVSVFLYCSASIPAQTQMILPFFKDVVIHLGLCFIALSYLVIVGSSNAVNLTDGLDGLTTMSTVMIAAALGIFAYVMGNSHLSHYLLYPYLPYSGEITIICSAMVGAGLGFLWFNTYPAQVFMGDVGALSLGAGLGIIAVMIRQEIVLFIMAGIMVIETISVIMQVISFKLTGKRIFRMAPLHHHFELKGLPEPRIIIRFWIITFILVLIGLTTLKIR